MTEPQKPQRIAVLGAGPMGLAVAYQLVLDGHRPVIFEADDRVETKANIEAGNTEYAIH